MTQWVDRIFYDRRIKVAFIALCLILAGTSYFEGNSQGVCSHCCK